MNEVKKILENQKVRTVAKVILVTVGVAGLLTLAAVAPNAGQALTLFGIGKRRKYSMPSYVTRKVYDLERRGLVRFEKMDGVTYIKLTPAGEFEFSRLKVASRRLKKLSWDGRWRFIIFDIGEYRKPTRDLFRRELSNFGFRHLQDSVWVSPYDCEEFVVLLKSNLKLGRDVLYFTVADMEDDYQLRRLFSL